MTKFLRLVILIAAFSMQACLYSQSNPFFAPGYENPNPSHWMFTPYEDTISGSWSGISPLQQPLFGVNAYYWSQNNKVFICGGATQDVVPQTACYWYNPVNDTYEPAAPLPSGRWSGKLVRVRDSLYLIGSVDSTFNSADGLIYRYSLNENIWVQKQSMPVPFVHECAAAVINDSLIVTIGGSTNAFLSAVNYVRVYNPWRDAWTPSQSVYPVNNTSSHAENLKVDTTNNIIVLGGYGSGPLSSVYKGKAVLRNNDSINITWEDFDTLGTGFFGQGVYRVAGARWQNGLNDCALFGPSMNGANAERSVWGLRIYSDTSFVWSKFDPLSPDSIGNISTYGVKSGADTNYFFMFGGFKNPNVVSTAQKYTFATPPPPIGIISYTGSTPKEYRLFQNYPNPFNPSTTIRFSVPENSGDIVQLAVYDVTGREVAVLVNEKLAQGDYEAVFSAERVSSGVYFYALSGVSFKYTKKMVIIK